ncbi:WD40 repeat domain-containing protein [Paractinoplanes lichenicola]|uniref:PD40 domain-containing protein n=1 Tax=Paractinoplanes lichenicola TaxID=2802976 RepID=A0ABS1VLI7_9ACTN|nr:PD40 domain-containing protein [Actinoplanes lichenicola]MBL7255580.1 PD40 domain-containing protein [Actinoplanes lichenicola]
MTAHLREELRREAATAKTYDAYAGSLRRARRGRRRTAVVWAVLVAALALAVPFTPRLATTPAADSGAISLPDKLGLPAYGARGVSGLGAASVVYSGYGPRFGPWFDDHDTYGLVGARKEDYRKIHTGLVDDEVLLAPDGATLAVPDRLIDLDTGAERPLPGFPLAWSPDGRRLVTDDGTLRIVDVSTGAATDLATTAAQTSAAWSPDGTRLAYAYQGRLTVIGPDTKSFELGFDGVLAGKGAWTPDGRAVAVAEQEDRAPRWFDPATGREVDGPDLPAVDGTVYRRWFVGWRPDGSALVFVLGDEPRLLALTPGADRPTPAMTLPSQVSYLDLADAAIDSGAVREGDSPFFIGPWWWLRLGAGGLVVLAVVLIVRRLNERARTRRVVAIPWETTHGPLV